MTFDEFTDEARELFGLDAGEASELADSLDQAGFPLEEFDSDDSLLWEVASDLTDEFFDDYEEYDLDPYFPDDEYLEPDIEWELTAETEPGYGEKTT